MNANYGQYTGCSGGTIMWTLELIAITLTILALVSLNIKKDKINKEMFFAFQFLLWVCLLFSLSFFVVSFARVFFRT
jgi:hypothetical protein